MKKTSEMANPMERAQEFTKNLENVPSGYYLTGTFGSILLALGLFLMGRKMTSVFVGLWVPTILLLSLFFKLMRSSHQM